MIKVYIVFRYKEFYGYSERDSVEKSVAGVWLHEYCANEYIEKHTRHDMNFVKVETELFI